MNRHGFFLVSHVILLSSQFIFCYFFCWQYKHKNASYWGKWKAVTPRGVYPFFFFYFFFFLLLSRNTNVALSYFETTNTVSFTCVAVYVVLNKFSHVVYFHWCYLIRSREIDIYYTLDMWNIKTKTHKCMCIPVT